MATAVGEVRKERKSGVELLKLFAILLIIISHITQTLQEANPYISISGYIWDFSFASMNIQGMALQFMRSFGVFGNLVFFICSAWFLLNSNKVNTKKWLFILLEVWSVSAVIAVAFVLLKKGGVAGKHYIMSFFPSIFSNNWYLTCYLLFYPIHVFLNKMISQISQKSHLRFVISAFILYYVIDFALGSYFFVSELLLWIIVYLFISYIQKYMPDFRANKKLNITIVIVCTVLYLALIFVTNVIGLRVNYLNDKMLRWVANYNPFLLLSAICLFNLSINSQYTSKFVNGIAGLSLLIYVIHENILIRFYVRPLVLDYIKSNYGYSLIVLWVVILALITFLLSVGLSLIYQHTVGKLVKIGADWLYEKLKTRYETLEKKLLSVK